MNLASALRCQNLRLINLGWTREQILRLGKKRLGDLAVQMRIAPIFIRKRIEDAILPRPHLDRIPGNSPGSRSAKGCADFKNSSTSFSFPGLASSCAQIASIAMCVFLLPI